MTCTKQYLKWLLMYFEEITKANYFSDFSGRSDGKESACNMGDRVQSLGGPWKREWQHTLVFLPGELHGQRSLVGYSPWSHKESFQLDFTFSLDSTVY